MSTNAVTIREQAMALPAISPEDIEKALTIGDISKMPPEVRVRFYLKTCESMGLNPYTRPLIAMKTQSGEVMLYATAQAAEQLRKRDRVSIKVLSREKDDGLYIVTVLASTPDGRSEESQGIVDITGQKGTTLANSLMKAETKGKRRATLALCGMGYALDDDAAAVPVAFSTQTGVIALDETMATLYVRDEPEKGLAEHIGDLYGDPPSTVADGGSLIARIEQAHAQAGHDARWCAAYWVKMAKRFQVPTRGALSPQALEGLVKEVVAYYDRQQAEAKSAVEATSEPAEGPVSSREGSALAPWRGLLADVLGDVRDANLVREATAVLEDPDATDAAGEALLARVLNLIDAQESGQPF